MSSDVGLRKNFLNALAVGICFNFKALSSPSLHGRNCSTKSSGDSLDFARKNSNAKSCQLLNIDGMVELKSNI